LPFDPTRAISTPSELNSSTYPSPPPATAFVFAGFCRAYVTKTLPPSSWIPNGAQPAGILGSSNPPTRVAGLNEASRTSTRALWKSVAYRRSAVVASPS
jgi:hypothetical protein